ncbi:hypothetical protein NIES4071_23350 [Calothrix sp. NIES-4071]|nr:hypothetical protein NIES4071_23350 [Calothrix sp. NIES-4071]BAZ56660.1 hypothetical protein NIES4105_23300 [Calothrix sp. NIES-4105]
MRYTLKSRFRGTFAGAILALKVASENESEYISQAYINTTFSCKSLIAQGKFDVNCFDLQTGVKRSEQLVLFNTFFSALPVALFFHEDLSKLRHNLLEVARAHSDNLVIRDSVLAIGYAIAQSLNENFQTSILSEIIKFIGETPTNVPQKLQTVNDLINSQVSLEQASTELYKVNTVFNTVATAFYTFLKSIEDFRLSVSLSLKSNTSNFSNHDYFLSGAITGALSGAYNSALGIPISWQMKYLRSNSTKKAENDFLQMLRLTDELLALWSGAYEFDNQEPDRSRGKSLCNYLPLLEENSHLRIYAAPRIIRSR